MIDNNSQGGHLIDVTVSLTRSCDAGASCHQYAYDHILVPGLDPCIQVFLCGAHKVLIQSTDSPSLMSLSLLKCSVSDYTDGHYIIIYGIYVNPDKIRILISLYCYMGMKHEPPVDYKCAR